MSLIYLDKSFLASLSYAICAIFLLPPLSNLLLKILKKPISKKIKIILLIFFFILGAKYTPQIETNSNLSKIKPTEKIGIKKINKKITPDKKLTPTKILTPTKTPTPTLILYPVAKVIDGDTIRVKIDNNFQTIRLIGINAPESVDPRKPVECFGREAANKAKEILSGKKVRLEKDPTQGDKDKYNRLLRYVFLEDGTNFNKLMILEGYAHEYTYIIPYRYQQEFKEAEKFARENKKGLWADNACVINPTTPPQKESSGSYICDCSKTCSQISSCNEAYYQLNTCGCTARDADHDGIPCENICF